MVMRMMMQTIFTWAIPLVPNPYLLSPPVSISPATMTQVTAPALPIVSSTASDDNSVEMLISPATMTQVAGPALPMVSSTASDDNSVGMLISLATMKQVATPALCMVSSTASDNNSVDMLYPVVFIGGLLDLLYKWYGFLPNANVEYINTLNWRATLSILRLTSNSPHIWDLHTNENLCNIHPESPEMLELNSHLHIFMWKTGLKNEASSAKVYFIQSADCSDGMKVMLSDTATVLECYHQFKKLEDVITFLFINGRPFYMFVPQTCIPPPQPICMKHSPTLGYYPKDYKACMNIVFMNNFSKNSAIYLVAARL
jgi:hypothetical protein